MFQLAIFQTLLFLVASVAAINNTIVIIGNAETPSLHRRGLTPVGKWRVDNCIPQVHLDSIAGTEFLTCWCIGFRRFRFWSHRDVHSKQCHRSLHCCLSDCSPARCLAWVADRHVLVMITRHITNVVVYIFCFSSGTGEESEDDCLSDLLIRYSKTSTKPVLVVWVSDMSIYLW